MEVYGYVYLVKNLVNGKMYFGITERGKQMEIIIVCNKNVQSEVGVGITIRNYKRAGKQDGK